MFKRSKIIYKQKAQAQYVDREELFQKRMDI